MPAWEGLRADDVGEGWKLFVNDLDKVESPLLKSLLTSWKITEEELDVREVQLTGMFVLCYVMVFVWYICGASGVLNVRCMCV